MGKKKSSDEAPVGAPAWMATFGDLMTNLLTFFVLLLSFSTVQQEDFNNAMGSLQGALGLLNSTHESINFIVRTFAKPVSYRFRFVRQGQISSFKRPEYDLNYQSTEYHDTLTDVVEEITAEAKLYGVADLISVDFHEKGIKIRIPGVILFDESDNKLKDDEKTFKLLDKMIEVINKLPYYVTIEGHTDNKPISSNKFDSNWELASGRAMTVLKYLQSKGVEPKRMAAVSYGEFQPYTDNETLKGRKLNRRIEINFDVSKQN